MPPSLPDGRQTGRCGPVPAPVSLSLWPDAEPGRPMRGICGPTYTAWSVPAGRLSWWESRLRARLGTIGSTEFALIWRHRRTPAGRSISRLAPWTPPISAAGSTGSPWATPRVSTNGGIGYGTPERMRKARLEDQACGTATWATPAARDYRYPNNKPWSEREGGKKGEQLPEPGPARSAWSGAVWLTGADGKARRTKPGIRLLSHGIPGRVGQLRGLGNAIVPPLAAEVLKAFLEGEQP